MYEFVRFYVCSFELQFLMPYEDSDNPNSIFYVFRVRYIYLSIYLSIYIYIYVEDIWRFYQGLNVCQYFVGLLIKQLSVR